MPLSVPKRLARRARATASGRNGSLAHTGSRVSASARMCRLGALFGAVLISGLSPAASTHAASPKATTCALAPRPAAGDTAHVTGLGADGSLTLDDGRHFAPDRIALPTRLEPSRKVIEAAGGAVTATLGGRTITFSRAQTDRHGRLVGEAVMTDGPDAGADIATILVAAGAAFTDAQGPCAAALLSAEAQAREARRGLWAEPGAIASATDEAEMSRRLGLYTVTEGRILSVGVRRERTYLNFGESWRRDFTLMVPTRDFAIILGQGQDPVILRGARIRARGVVREQGGPAIMIRSQADIERLSDRTGSED